MNSIVHTVHGFDLQVSPPSFFGQVLQQHHNWEAPETELVKRLVRPGDFCIDAGAYIGYYTLLMAKCGAEVLSIEANPRLFDLLSGNVGKFMTDVRPDARIHVVGAAVHDINGQASFHLPSQYDDGWGSLAAADSDNGLCLVPTQRLDTFEFDNVRLIKMDVEGSELQALMGLGSKINKVDYLLIECVDITKRMHYGSSAAGVGQYLQARGFRPWLPDGGGNWCPVNAVQSIAQYNHLFTHPRIKEVGE